MRGLSIIVADDGYRLEEFEGGLRELQAVVGGWVEAIPSNERVTIWVNEEGKFAPLPVNRLAMDVWLRWDDFGCTLHGDWIAGNAVVTGGTGPDGETLDLAEGDRRWVLRVARDGGLPV